MNTLPAIGPTVVHAHNIMNPSARRVFRGRPGASLQELAPETANPWVCLYNGEPVDREDLDYVPHDLDHVSFVVLPKGGGNASQTIFGIVLIAVGVYTANAGVIAAGIGMLASGLMPAPNFAPLTETQTQAPSPTYTLSVSGNTARLGGAVPVLYGRHILVPDFVNQPYTEYVNNNQFFHALFCLGAGNMDIESIQIDDTDITHFEGVETYVRPIGDMGNVVFLYDVIVNASEVANQDLLRGQYAGPFAVCGPGLSVVAISIDTRFPRGLYYADSSGNLGNMTIKWFVEARKINDDNLPIGPWKLLGAEEVTMATNTPQGITRTYGLQDVGGAGRYEVRMSRQDVRDSNVRAGHDLQWAGMRGYFTTEMPDNRAMYLAVRMKATSQLSGLSQRKFAVIGKRKLKSWDPLTGWSAEETHTRSIAWALADVLKNPVYGRGLPDNRIDLRTLWELDQVWTARGDFFDGVFDKRVTTWSALTTIARAGRARPIMRGSVFTFVRDAAQELPVALFSMRNIERGSFTAEYSLRSEDESDGLELEYYDSKTWSARTIAVPVPGKELNQVIASQRMSIMGVTNYAQAMREALYIVADATYRRQRISFTTEMEGYLPAYGDLIAVSHDLVGWGVSGEFESWDAATFTAQVNEELPWGDGDHYCVLIGAQGDVFGPLRVVAGEDKRSMVFLDPLPAGLSIYVGTERERTRYSMGPGTNYAKMCRVTGLVPKDGLRVQIKAVVEDNRVHTADADVPPDPGTGGPGGGGTGPKVGRYGRYAPDGVPPYDNATENDHNTWAFFTDTDVTVGTANEKGYVYAPDQ